ncbi:DUF1289 domain-containing protein [Vibrio breoganii]|uniref:DUF1289 domain-containing protein n=1 Tax=Vibrio breoganii TaxID=553239 RepID=A0AAJ3SC38_9VIBR|nr:DUF1289 domain-containing protein [Vibrio breoganii]ANO33005.1 Fe-S protein [Vibrio breoganii]MDN3714645.1 DUF1289 domain-containing protein [Vibrio breoganii]NMO72446.1 DUF1289 domain-containing protein [Vibrio breoganii]NMR68974.1 DUF1289 domain-containing protein [Vibrio breoganii]OCH76458.1 Fe-S protein [Vibrio breoganii]
MEQLDFFDVPSPCIGVCSSDERGYCKGCMRNRDERFAWQTLSSTDKKHVIKLCRQRYRRKMLKGKQPLKPNEDEVSSPQGDLF